MSANGDDAGRCANGLTARRFREASEEERASYRAWVRGIILFYCALGFISGVVAVTYSGMSRPQLTTLSVQQTVAAARGE